MTPTPSSDDLKQFQAEARAWLEANCPESQRTPVGHGELVMPGKKRRFPSEDARLWFERTRDIGWTCPEFPACYGGGGLSPAQGEIVRREMKRLGCRPPLTDAGISMLGPALLEFGSEALKEEHLPKIVRGEIAWCQGYSEPGAGSDLASLSCRAETMSGDDADHYLVNGSKIWTSFGVESDWIFCLVRTDPDASKQQGISFLLIDMDTPGVTVTPIGLISGASEFAQVFFDNVKVPKANLVHRENDGWTVAKALLKHERRMMSELGGSVIGGNLTLLHAARTYIGLDQEGGLKQRQLRGPLVQYEMRMRAMGLTGKRLHDEAMNGQPNKDLARIMKLVSSEALQEKDELMTELVGYRSLGWQENSFTDDELRAGRELLFNKAMTIAGGTSEIQLNIIAQRVLGLPQA